MQIKGSVGPTIKDTSTGMPISSVARAGVLGTVAKKILYLLYLTTYTQVTSYYADGMLHQSQVTHFKYIFYFISNQILKKLIVWKKLNIIIGRV